MIFRNRYWLVLMALLALLVFVGCSDDDDPVTPPADPTVTETIGAAGGTLEKQDEFELVIPAGALAADVDFVGGPSETPPTLPTGFVNVSDFFTIEPSGTDFGQDATLVLHYNEDDIPTFIPEDYLEVMTFDGTKWDDLGGDVDEDNNTVTVDISHLSDFVVVSPDPGDPDPVFLEFEIGREYYGSQAKAIDGYDYLEADFYASDKSKAPDYLEAGDVAFGAWDLQWGRSSYYYSSDDTPMFLTLGSTYDLVVEGSIDVMPLTLPVTVMDEVALMTNISDNQELDLGGFTVTWGGTSLGGMIDIRIYLEAGSSISRTVENTGSFTFTDTDLDALSAGPGEISLKWYTSVPVVAEGYLEESRIELETSQDIPVTFTGGGSGEPQVSTVVSTPNLSIPDGPSGGGPGPAATDIINMPVTGTIENVRVYLDISHQWMSDLIVKLTSPDGTQLRVLFIGEGGETDGRMQGWYPDDFTPKDDLSGFDGETAGGDWTLTCQDYSSGAAGILNEWRLEVTYTQ